jgi:hypothetical protein
MTATLITTTRLIALLLTATLIATLGYAAWAGVRHGIDAVQGIHVAGMPFMPWSEHYGDAQGCWNADTRADLYQQGRLPVFDALYCPNGHA